ncbi:hypothetical protein C1H76_2732 [Elsinoe australis]|uniref:Uncharacterized protein n=1 Tax=Elsinoe australis TaxID=40998 RepID=A0A4V6DUL4_9PEZI|nr:hypothetical protein C1H76_2732 [Elsinoe australis]
MSAQNRSLTPPKQSPDEQPSSSTKRKRSDAQDDVATASKLPSLDNSVSTKVVDKEVFEDVLAILYQSEAGPAVLNSSVSSPADAQPAKKTKLSEPAESKTVSEKVADGRYTSLEELERDVIRICEDQISEIKRPDENSTSRFKRLTEDNVAQIQDYMSFETTVRDLVARESKARKRQVKQEEDTIKVNGVKSELGLNKGSLALRAGRTVLSLYGHALTPKQLFSSLQDEASTDLPLEELGLPTMLTATRLLPLPEDDSSKSKSRTFGEVFAPPSSLPQLQPPPKQSKSASGRNPSIGFLSPDRPPPKATKKLSYPYQPLSVGGWVRYGTQPRVKTKTSERPRDRSGSMVEKERPEGFTVPPQREEDLFVSAYSSFAPTYDNARAIIPADSKNLIWWQRGGRRKLQSIFASEEQNDEMDVDGVEDDETTAMAAAHEKAIFEEVVQNFDEKTMDAADSEDQRTPAELEAQELLAEINELLQALASYQRIRSSHIPSHSRTPSISSPSPVRSTLIGTPTEPSPDEVDTYRALKERLAELIARLPPYTVSKMDGQQIEDLRVNTTILLENKNIRGVLEEDQLTRLAKATAAAAASNASVNRASSNTGYGQYGRTSSLTGNRPALTPQPYQGGRTSMNYGRTTSNLAAATPSAQTNRNSYTQLGAQTAPVNRTQLQPSYGQSNNGQYYRQPYSQQLSQSQASQGSPQPAAQRWGNQYSNSQSQYQGGTTQFRNTTAYNHNSFGQQPSYGQQSMQRPGSNGRSTPVSNIAPAPPRVNSPMRPIQSTEVPRPSSATPQPSGAPQAQMNGVQMNGS